MSAALRAWWLEFVRRYRSLTHRGGRRFPAAAGAISIAIVLAALVTRPFFSTIDPATYSDLGWRAADVLDGAWWRIVSASVLSRDPFMTLAMVVSVMIQVGFYERIAGPVRAFWVSVTGSWFGFAAVTLGLAILKPLGWSFIDRTLQSLDVGFSAGVAAAWAGIIAAVDYRPAKLSFAMVVIGGLVVHHQVADWQHAFTAIAYYALLSRIGPRYGDAPGGS